jgi:hypothetical protein
MKKGYVKSPEWIRKISEANKGKPSPRKGKVFVPPEIQRERKLAYRRAWYQKNRERVCEQHREWWSKNREKLNADAREHYPDSKNGQLVRHRRRKYNIDEKTFIGMVEAQGGKCLICGEIPNKNLSVDHNHITGKIRGLICNSCNIAIAKAKDSPILLRAMADYLEKFDG